MELENQDRVPVEIPCDCGHKAGFAVRLSTGAEKCDIYFCEACEKEIRVPVKE